jgi:hypothetical protein
MLYPEGGKFHVSLGIPGQQSKICKGIGITASVNFLIPTIEYILKCAVEGDLGISDTIKKNKAVQYLNRCKSEQTIKQFSKLFGVSIEGDLEKYKKNGRYNIPHSAISLSSESDSSNSKSISSDIDYGLKMIEKTIIKSIFEQYKPWIEIVKLIIQNLAQIEDVIARASGLLAPSKKPKFNGGNNKIPKSLGYQGADEIKKSIAKLESLSKKKPGFYEKSKQQNQSKTLSSATFSGIENLNDYPTASSYEYKVVSTVYSTGVFKEGVDYEYQYIDIPSDEEIKINNLDESISNIDSDINIDIDDNDPYKGKRPKTIILGIYDSKGNPINPEDPIRIPKYNPDGSLSINQGQVDYLGILDVSGEEGIQSISKADWVARTGRWFGHFERKDAIYLWRHKNNKNNIKASGTNPQIYDNGWIDGPYEQLFYKDPKKIEVDKDIYLIEEDGRIIVDSQYIGTLNEGGDADAPVYYFKTNEKELYKEMFIDIIDKKFNKSTELTSEEKEIYKAEIMNNVDIQSYLESISNYGFFSSIFKNGVTNPPINKGLDGSVISTGLPPNMKKSFMPKKIKFNNEDIWIDPESDYKMKIIKVDPSTKIRFSDNTANGVKEFEAEIIRFVKNSVEIRIDNGSKFDVDVIRNTNINSDTPWQPYVAFQTEIPGRYENISKFTIDNWNYKDSYDNLTTSGEIKFNNMSMLLRVTSNTPPPFWLSKITSNGESYNNNKGKMTDFYEWVDDGNYILGIVNGYWKIGKYDEYIKEIQTLSPWSTNAITIDINDPFVSRVKVRNIGNTIYDNDIIVGWYYNNKWNDVPPSTWQISPNFNSPNTIIDYNIINNSSERNIIGDVGQKLTAEIINYNISGYKYTDKIPTTQPSFGLIESSKSGKFIQRYKLKIKKKVIIREFKSIQFENERLEFINLNLTFGDQVGKLKLYDGSYAYFNKQNYKLIKWEYLFFDSTKLSFSNGETGRIINNNVNILPINVGQKINWTINYNKIGNKNNNTPLVITNEIIPPNQIRLKETDNPFGKLLDPRNIRNRHLAEDNPLIDKYSNGMYGHSEPENKQTIEQIFRHMKSEFDVETYYIVEGVLSEDDTNLESSDTIYKSKTSDSSTKNEYYEKPHAIGAIKVFISVLSDIFSKLIPSIKRLISIFKNPANFISEIIKEKLGENTKIFSPQFINDYNQMISLPKTKRREFVKSSSLRDYVYVNPVDGEHIVLFDGAAMKNLGTLFGSTITFGMEVNKAIPNLIFKIDLAKMTSNSLDSILKGTANKNNISISNSNIDTTSNKTISSMQSSIDGETDPNLLSGEVTIIYSTGKYIEGIEYEYIYVNEYVSKLVKEGDDLAESNDPEKMNLAFVKYDEALMLDPDNNFIKDRISNLMNKIPNYVQPIIEFLLSFVSAPIKILADIVQFIMDFFTKLKIKKLNVDIPKFLSFKWLIKEDDYGWSKLKGGFFSPGVLFKAFGLDILPISIPGITPPNWTTAAGIFATYMSGEIPDMPKLNKDTIPPGMPVVNQPPNPLSNFNNSMSLSFSPFMKRPTVDKTVFPVGLSNVSKEHLLTWFKKNPRIDYKKFSLTGMPPILESVAQFICFVESIINSVIDIFWSILGLEALIPPPHLNLCKNLKSNNMSLKDIMNLNDDNPDYDFTYEIKTSDGKNIRDLNREELQRWLDDNSDYEFEFLFK